MRVTPLRPAILYRALFAFALFWPVADAALTLRILNAGGREFNPLLAPLLASPSGALELGALKASVIVATILYARLCVRVPGRLARIALWIVLAFSTLLGVITLAYNVLTLMTLM